MSIGATQVFAAMKIGLLKFWCCNKQPTVPFGANVDQEKKRKSHVIFLCIFVKRCKTGRCTYKPEWVECIFLGKWVSEGWMAALRCFVLVVIICCAYWTSLLQLEVGRVAQSVGHLTRKSGILGSIPGLATYFCFSFRFFKKGSCQLLAKVCARSTG